MNPDDVTLPETEAGRRLVNANIPVPVWAILAIEAEARAPLEARDRERAPHVQALAEDLVAAEAQVATLVEELAWATRTLRRHHIISDERHAELQALLAAPTTDIPARIKAEAVAEWLTVERMEAALVAIWDRADSQEWPQAMCHTCNQTASQCQCDDDSADIHPAKPLAGTWYVGHRWLLLDGFAAALRVALLTENQP